ncbi:sce7726 family protein [Azospirillum humicireducens]|uniref:sce7726 family protein n=1 Tax=Azospirillum humicireducens TaxID=1226968 RepID=UPI0011B24AD1|nr:sce7726 family protein [Azospirillum humicireducens]
MAIAPPLTVRSLEPQIKCAVIEKLREREDFCDAVLASEFSVSGLRRADLVFANRHLEAFEIKSLADNLDRLSGQISTYMKYFNKVTVVTDILHEEKILRMTPNCVEVWRFSINGTKKNIKIIRRGRTTKINSRVAFQEMLRVHEIKSVLRENAVTYEGERRAELIRKTDHISLSKLQKAVVNAVKSRFVKTFSNFLIATEGREILPDDLRLLSPHINNNNFRSSNPQKISLEELLQQVKVPCADTSAHEDVFIEMSKNINCENLFGPVPEDIRRLLSKE